MSTHKELLAIAATREAEYREAAAAVDEATRALQEAKDRSDAARETWHEARCAADKLLPKATVHSQHGTYKVAIIRRAEKTVTTRGIGDGGAGQAWRKDSQGTWREYPRPRFGWRRYADRLTIDGEAE